MYFDYESVDGAGDGEGSTTGRDGAFVLILQDQDLRAIPRRRTPRNGSHSLPHAGNEQSAGRILYPDLPCPYDG